MRFFCNTKLCYGAMELPKDVVRHIQVLRLQPNDEIILFDGLGGQWQARITQMTKSTVTAYVYEHIEIERESAISIHLAIGIPANERMDWLVEKATELGVQCITPLMTERSVVRLNNERGHKKQMHWQAIAQSACEQCQRNQVPLIEPVQNLRDWTGAQVSTCPKQILFLSFQSQAMPLYQVIEAFLNQKYHTKDLKYSKRSIVFVSGPEGGLTANEETLLKRQGAQAVTLGGRVLRAETAPLAALSTAVMMLDRKE